jgi:glutathione S-transferase
VVPKLKLTYFDFHGGRGEPARLALAMGGIPFDDDRVPPSEWERRKPNTPFGALPVLEVDGQTLAQSNAINRYVGKLTDLYPTDAWQAALCDEVMEAVEDISTKIAATMFLPDEKEIAAQGASRRPNPFLSREATTAARSTWRPLLLCGPFNGRGSQGLRLGPAPKIRRP